MAFHSSRQLQSSEIIKTQDKIHASRASRKKNFRGVIDVVEYVRWCIDLQKGDTGAKKGHQDKTWMEGLMMKEHVD